MADAVGFVGRRLLKIGVSIGAALIAAAVFLAIGFRWWWCSLIGLAIMALVNLMTRRGRRFDPYPWERGLDGELKVSQILSDLEDHGFLIVEHIDIGYGDVDHVVIGPTGVFAVETKNWSGRVTAANGILLRNGQPADASGRQAVRGAIAIRERVRTRWVEAILVCPSAEVVGEPIDLGNVLVVSGTRLNALISNRPARMTHAEASKTAALLRVS
jgi:hypothetical protein